MVPEGSIHGRFQPFHNGHFELALAALERCVFLWIGIVGPVPGSRPLLTPEDPMTYHECQFMVTRTLVAEGVPPQRFTCVPFPVAEPETLDYYLDSRVTCYVPTGDPAGETRSALLESLGYPVEPLPTEDFDPTVLALLRGGDPAWRKAVPRSVAAYLEEIELRDRVRGGEGPA